MQHIAAEIERYGLLIVFLNVLLAEGGLPLPAFPMLIVAGALGTGGRYPISGLILSGVIACMMADLAWYWGGKRYGRRVLGLLCRMSLSPDVCVRQTESVFLKFGRWSLVFAKFFPALSTVSVAMAGVTGMPLRSFLGVDGIGALLFVSIAIGLGWLLQDAVADVLQIFSKIGTYGFLTLLGVLGLYLLARWWRRRSFIRQLRGDRITVDELRRQIGDGRKPLILDVRPQAVRMRGGVIPGAVSGNPADMDPRVMASPHDQEIVVYCACPNEASAAVAARRLKTMGFEKIRSLAGGIDAWVDAGEPVTPVHVPV